MIVLIKREELEQEGVVGPIEVALICSVEIDAI
jgi:hypothetical protein